MLVECCPGEVQCVLVASLVRGVFAKRAHAVVRVAVWIAHLVGQCIR